MLATEPLIRYCPFENSTDPLIAGSPTSPELLNTPKSPLWAKAKADNRQIQNIRRMIRVYVLLIGLRCYYRTMAGAGNCSTDTFENNTVFVASVECELTPSPTNIGLPN